MGKEECCPISDDVTAFITRYQHVSFGRSYQPVTALFPEREGKLHCLVVSLLPCSSVCASLSYLHFALDNLMSANSIAVPNTLPSKDKSSQPLRIVFLRRQPKPLSLRPELNVPTGRAALERPAQVRVSPGASRLQRRLSLHPLLGKSHTHAGEFPLCRAAVRSHRPMRFFPGASARFSLSFAFSFLQFYVFTASLEIPPVLRLWPPRREPKD
jgi:hypothetical protein